jgi:hypothetical protein
MIVIESIIYFDKVLELRILSIIVKLKLKKF